jgi:signal transduction histidine kinase
MAPDSSDEVGPSDQLAEAFRLLRVGGTDERLAAARLLGEAATRSETQTLEDIRRRELERYVRQAIDEAIRRSRERSPRVPQAPSVDDHLDEQPWDDVLYARALRSVTMSFAHELRRPVGLASAAAARSDLDGVNAYLERLKRLLNAMEQLVAITEAVRADEFDLGELLEQLAAEHRERFGLPIDVLAEASVRVRQNRDSVELIVCNALTNACESTVTVGSDEPRAIVLTCGITDREAWIGILDHGLGLPVGFEPFAFAASRRKDGHDGVGLALARRAARSMGGEASLIQREDGGATFRLTFPAPPS